MNQFWFGDNQCQIFVLFITTQKFGIGCHQTKIDSWCVYVFCASFFLKFIKTKL